MNAKKLEPKSRYAEYDTDGDGIPDPHAGLDSSRWDIDADGDNLFDYGFETDKSIIFTKWQRSSR